MSQTKFDFDAEAMPAVAFILYQAASWFLAELARDRGPGPWMEELRQELYKTAKNTVGTGFPMEKEVVFVKASMTAIDGVFDRVAWGDDGGPPAVDGNPRAG